MKGRTLGIAIFSLVVLGGYGAANVFAYDPFATSSETRELPPNVSSHAPRSGVVFWYGGFSGGK
ncbi:MAG: hypothetical protein AAF411_29470 [Myxococcota bacterium]